MNEKKESIIIKRNGKLLDILCDEKKDISKKDFKKKLYYQMIYVNNNVITNANYNLKLGDIVTIYYSQKKISDFELKIIYEDNDLIAIDKPYNLLSISSEKEKEKTAYSILRNYRKKINKNNYLFIVHRLDKDTSGVLLFAKNILMQKKLQNNWNDIVTKREYVAVVEGIIKKGGTVHTYLKENKFKFVYSSSNGEGKEAITNYEVLKYGKSRTLLKIIIETGRKNQIRVHLSEIGYPIVGDRKYGKKGKVKSRLALHATSLELIDPRNNKILKIKSPIPDEFKKIL